MRRGGLFVVGESERIPFPTASVPTEGRFRAFRGETPPRIRCLSRFYTTKHTETAFADTKSGCRKESGVIIQPNKVRPPKLRSV